MINPFNCQNSAMLTGMTILHRQDHLQNPAFWVDNPHWLTMDGIITVNGDDVVCCFAYFCENTTQVVGAGNYDIKAVVHSILLFHDIGTDFANAALPQVISMHEQMNDVLFEL